MHTHVHNFEPLLSAWCSIFKTSHAYMIWRQKKTFAASHTHGSGLIIHSPFYSPVIGPRHTLAQSGTTERAQRGAAASPFSCLLIETQKHSKSPELWSKQEYFNHLSSSLPVVSASCCDTVDFLSSPDITVICSADIGFAVDFDNWLYLHLQSL